MCECCKDTIEHPMFGRYMGFKDAKRVGACWEYMCWLRDVHKGYWRRRSRNELRRIPKRDPDDPKFCLHLGEGLLPFLFPDPRDERDWYFLIYHPTRRRRLYRLKAAGEGATLPKRVARGVEDDHTNGWPKLHDFYRK